MDEQLKPCPWGHPDAAVSTDEIELAITFVICRKCGAAGPSVDLGDHKTIAAAEAEAVRLWNTRPSAASPLREEMAFKAVARIIDPEAWAKYDQLSVDATLCEDFDRCEELDAQADQVVAPSLTKARQCLALIPSGAEGPTLSKMETVRSVPDAEVNRLAQELDCSPEAARSALDNLIAKGLVEVGAAPKAPASPLAEGEKVVVDRAVLEEALSCADAVARLNPEMRSIADEVAAHYEFSELRNALRAALSSSPITGKDGE